MNSKNIWKLLFVVFVICWSAFELYPPSRRDLLEEFHRKAINKDETFNQIVARAQELNKDLPQRAYGNLAEAAGTNSLSKYFPGIPVKNELNPNRAILNRIQKEAAGKIKLGLDLQGGSSFLVGMDTNVLEKASAEDRERVLGQAVEVLRKRVDKLGVAEPVITPVGDDRILIQMPGLSQSEKESAKRQIEKAAFLEFRMVHPQSSELIRQGIIEPGYEILRREDVKANGTKSIEEYLVKKKPERGLTGKNIERAMVTRDPMSNLPRISFSLDSKGADLFRDITRENIGRQLAIVLDGELYSAPVIRGEIPGGQGEISGQFTIKEAYELANVLENPLEAPVKILEERTVDPSLGRDSIDSGIRATMIGFFAVIIFMLIYYLFAGLVANVALLLNLLILMGVMASLEATLTLPGIAGILLTIGMAVDANVLIFERIREESSLGKSMRGALSAGYDKAFSTIFDANLTTLITSIILIFLGTGPVKGFGVTLSIGIGVSMFTALVVTRLIFDLLLAKGWLKSLPMLHVIGRTDIDFLKWVKPASILSIVVLVAGLGYGLKRGSDVMGVDFAGGDSMMMHFKEKAGVDELRAEIQKLNIGDVRIQYQKSIAEAAETLEIVSAFDTGPQVEAAIKSAFPQAGFEVIGVEKVGPTVGREILKTALVAVLLALFGVLVYVAFRYELSFAVGAVAAVIHDVAIAMGIFFISGRELSAPVVAAIMTIIGFSINDTIVIFDRIREDLKLGMRGSFKDIINRALNQTLSRTIITSGTTFLATAALYLFGGGVINDFAFTFLVGIIAGTYSSIYIAAALVLWWHKGERPRAAATVVSDGAQPAGA